MPFINTKVSCPISPELEIDFHGDAAVPFVPDPPSAAIQIGVVADTVAKAHTLYPATS